MSQIFKAASSQAGIVLSVQGTAPIQANGVSGVPQTGNVTISSALATTSTTGVASFNSSDFTVNGSGQVSLIGTIPGGYTNVTFLMSPYTVLPTDYFISVDATGGAVTINLPDSPIGTNPQFIIKDRLGQAAIHNITVKSLTGASTIDFQSSYTFIDAYESLETLFHPSNYEIF